MRSKGGDTLDLMGHGGAFRDELSFELTTDGRRCLGLWRTAEEWEPRDPRGLQGCRFYLERRLLFGTPGN